MENDNMNIKCAQCGLVNWSTEVECKRCRSLLTVQGKSAQDNYFDNDHQPQRFFSSGLQLLTVILGLATVAFFSSRVFELLDGETAKLVAVIFFFSGIVLLLLTHLWLLVRIFEQSVGWGLGALLIPLIGLFAVAKFWDNTKRSFVGQLVCLGIVMVGYQIAPPSVWKP